MIITVVHKTIPSIVKSKIDNFLNDLMTKSFPGVTIKDIQKSWNGYILDFSFKAKKGMIAPTVSISGTVVVEDSNVIMNLNLPSLVTAFVSESKIEAVILEKLMELFPER